MNKIQLFTSEIDIRGRTMEVHAFGIDLGITNYIVAEAWGK